MKSLKLFNLDLDVCCSMESLIFLWMASCDNHSNKIIKDDLKCLSFLSTWSMFVLLTNTAKFYFALHNYWHRRIWRMLQNSLVHAAIILSSLCISYTNVDLKENCVWLFRRVCSLRTLKKHTVRMYRKRGSDISVCAHEVYVYLY